MVRRVLVTGANRGIGKAIVNRCLQDHNDTAVIMACRSAASGEAARAELVADHPEWTERLMVLEMDTSSDASVQAAAAKLAADHAVAPLSSGCLLYGIVNNAGIASGTVAEILNVNVRGPKRVDDAFMPLLDQQEGRIVQMSSGAASGCVERCSVERQAFLTNANVEWAAIEQVMEEVESYPNGASDLKSNGIGTSMGAYGLSKALLNSYTMLAARQHPMLKINACSPGMIATDIMGNFLPWWVPLPNAVVRTVAQYVMGAKTPDEGTTSTMHLLFSDGLQASGQYFGSDARRSPLDKYRAPGSAAYDPREEGASQVSRL